MRRNNYDPDKFEFVGYAHQCQENNDLRHTLQYVGIFIRDSSANGFKGRHMNPSCRLSKVDSVERIRELHEKALGQEDEQEHLHFLMSRNLCDSKRTLRQERMQVCKKRHTDIWTVFR